MNAIPIILIVTSICQVESSNRHNAINIYDGGSSSYGYCQIKWSTAKWLERVGLVDGQVDITELWFNKEVNFRYAVAYFIFQYNRYKNIDKAIYAYNAGNANKWNKNSLYLQKVKRIIQTKRLSQIKLAFRDATP